MIRQGRALILTGIVGIGGLLGLGATTAQAQGYGFYGPRQGPTFQLGIGIGGGGGGYGYDGGYGGYRGGYGRGYNGGGYGGGNGYGGGYAPYRPRPYYYSSQTTVTTIVYCNACGQYHDRDSGCGGGGHRGGYDGYSGGYPW